MEAVTDMEKANRQLRRASGTLGCLAQLWLIGFWATVLIVAAVVLYAFVS